jgi:hypothetical protein
MAPHDLNPTCILLGRDPKRRLDTLIGLILHHDLRPPVTEHFGAVSPSVDHRLPIRVNLGSKSSDGEGALRVAGLAAYSGSK